MTKKILCVVLLMLMFVCILTSCSGDNATTTHSHSFDEWKITQEASCLLDGTKERTCTDCQFKEKEIISAHHDYSEQSNCCTVCNEEKPTECLEFRETDGGWEVFHFTSVPCIGGAHKIPTTYNGTPVVKVGNFFGDNITSIIVPNGVIEISDYAFDGNSSLRNIIIEDTVTRVGRWAFSNCSELYSVTIGTGNASEGVTVIDKCAFSACKDLEYLTLNNCVKEIGELAFYDCTFLDTVKLSGSIEKIGDSAFNKSGIRYIAIPDGVKIIDKQAFWDCPLKYVIIPKSVTYIGDEAFEWCTKLESIYFEGSAAEWNAIDNNYELKSYNDCFFYHEKQPQVNGVLWRYVNGEPRTWACSNCGGDGYVLISYKLYTCSKCDGTGNDY